MQGTLYRRRRDPAAATAQPTSRATTTSAACPGHQVPAHRTAAHSVSRMRCAPSAPSSVCPTKSSGVSPFPGRVWASASSARSPRAPRPAARGRRHRPRGTLKAGLDRDIWQCRSCFWLTFTLSASGRRRTYGSPIVLRPVSSEDAMTADWSDVPYDVLATISTRITNECRQINRVVLDCTSKPPATIEWGVIALYDEWDSPWGIPFYCRRRPV